MNNSLYCSFQNPSFPKYTLNASKTSRTPSKFSLRRLLTNLPFNDLMR